MKRLLCTLVLAGACAALAVTPALAGRGGSKGSQTIVASCQVMGSVTVHASSGQSAWVNGSHWVVYRFSGTFTPVNGTPVSFTKVYGRKHGFRSAHDMCSGSQTDSSGNTFSFTAWVYRTPAR